MTSNKTLINLANNNIVHCVKYYEKDKRVTSYICRKQFLRVYKHSGYFTLRDWFTSNYKQLKKINESTEEGSPQGEGGF